MAKVPDNQNQNAPKGSVKDIIDQKANDISAQLADIDKALQNLNKDQLTAEEVLEKKRLQNQQRRLNRQLKIEKGLSVEYEKTRGEADRRLRTLKLRAEKKAIQDLAQLEAAGIETNLQTKARLQQKYLQEETASRLRDEIRMLEEIRRINEQSRQKELEVLERRKAVLEAEKKTAEAKDQVKEAKKSGDKGKVKEAKKEAKSAKKEEKKKTKDIAKNARKSGGIIATLKNLGAEAKEQAKDEEALAKIHADNTAKAMKAVGKSITAGLNAINDSITSYAKHQTAVNARLNGLKGYSGGGNIFQSAGYGKIADNLNKIAFSPLLNAEELYNNVAEIVGQGIAVNIEQRAMFATLKDGIATTFDVTSESLKRIIRLQQNDSTAARLGLEAYLNEFLNVYTQNTEYLQQTFDSVADSLLEASALMKYNNGDAGVAESLEFEFQVQKWLGTLTGYGFSDEASNNIANAIGQLATGNVESLVSSDINNLLLMAANKGGVSYSDMLSNGMTADDVNNLMYGIVSYMQEVAENDNNIIKNQLAKVFGVGITDLIAATNIQTGVLEDLRNESLSYEGMYGALKDNFNELPARLGISNILENAFANMSYQTGANIAKNPALYAMWKITDMIQQNTGGIAIPAISVYGNGFDLETTVENLMKLGIAGTALLGNIGGIISGVASLGSGSSLLSNTGVSMEGAVIQQIEGGLSKSGKDGKRSSGDSSSEGTVVGNNDGDTYKDSAVNDAEDESQKKLDKKKEEERHVIIAYLEDEVEFIQKLEAMIAGLTAIDEDVTAALTDDVITAITQLDTDILAALAQIDANLIANVGANQQTSGIIQSVLASLSAVEDNAKTYYERSLEAANNLNEQGISVRTSGWKSAAEYTKAAGGGAGAAGGGGANPSGASGQGEGTASGGASSSSTVINMTSINGITKDEVHEELDPLILLMETAVDALEVIKAELIAENTKVSTIDSTLSEIRSLNEEIVSLLPPELTIPDIIVPEIQIPEIQIPEIQVPEIQLSDIQLPEIEIPELAVTTPEVNVQIPNEFGAIATLLTEIRDITDAISKVVPLSSSDANNVATSQGNNREEALANVATSSEKNGISSNEKPEYSPTIENTSNVDVDVSLAVNLSNEEISPLLTGILTSTAGILQGVTSANFGIAAMSGLLVQLHAVNSDIINILPSLKSQAASYVIENNYILDPNFELDVKLDPKLDLDANVAEPSTPKSDDLENKNAEIEPGNITYQINTESYHAQLEELSQNVQAIYATNASIFKLIASINGIDLESITTANEKSNEDFSSRDTELQIEPQFEFTPNIEVNPQIEINPHIEFDSETNQIASVDSISNNLEKLWLALDEITATYQSANNIQNSVIKEYETRKNSSESHAFTMSSTVVESLTTAVKSDTTDVVEILSKSVETMYSTAGEIASITPDTDYATPQGEVSQLTPSNNQNGANTESADSMLATDSAAHIDGYVHSSMFESDFKSIVENVAKMVNGHSTKEWSNPASSQATGSFGNNTYNYNNNESIDGLTQHANPLFI